MMEKKEPLDAETDCVVYQEHKEIYRHTWGYENIEKIE